MSTKDSPKKLPPYVPYKTLINFLESLKIALPQRIDRSLMASMSGSLQGQLMLALEYLDLITDTGVPTEKLNRLVHSEDAEYQRELREIITSSYRFLFEDGLQLDRATASQLRERFDQTGAKGDTLDRCLRFFMSIAGAAGIELSPHVKKVRIRVSQLLKPGRGIKRKIEQEELPTAKSTASPPPQEYRESESVPLAKPEEVSLEKILLSKFPSFDPAWPEEVQKKWFDGFDKLMDKIKKKGD
jgi:hypothetical protein